VKKSPETSAKRTQRNFLRGAITTDAFRGGSFEDALPPEAFAGERITPFFAASSWFWYCYPCVFQNAVEEESHSRPAKQ
jgi:hypothetical protein